MIELTNWQLMLLRSVQSLPSVANVIVEWLMGHDIGIANHYLAHIIKQEYFKFDSIRISIALTRISVKIRSNYFGLNSKVM